MTLYIEEPAKRTAVVNDVDVVVVGGGMAGVGAAVTAARVSASTILMKEFGFCGGLATGGLVNVYWVLDDGEGNNIISGLSLEILEYLRKFHSLRGTEAWRGKSPRTSRILPPITQEKSYYANT
jgi:flavin-dependent dehydrogenase